jgi:DNA-directed RNA polymerase specialized sigma subunit
MILDIIRVLLQLSDERRKRVIELYFSQYKTYADIAEIERMSPPATSKKAFEPHPA